MKKTYCIIIGITILCLLHGIPFLIYYDISPITKSCSSMNNTLTLYLPIFVLVIFFLISACLTMIFGCLTYKNIKESIGLSNHNVDRQLTIMICMQIILILWSTIPYGIFTIYSLLTNNIIKDIKRLYEELFTFTIISINTYVHTCVCII